MPTESYTGKKQIIKKKFARFFQKALFILGVSLASGALYAAPMREDIVSLSDINLPVLGYTHLPYVNPDAPKGGSLTIGALGSFDSLNPFILRGTAPDTIYQIWQPLFKLSDIDSVTAYAELARSVTISANQIVFHLDPAAIFSDGMPVTASDVVWTYQTLITKGLPFYSAEYADVETAKVVDPHTVMFTLKPGAGPDTVFNLSTLYVLPKHFWDHRDFTAPLRDAPIGSGAYRVSSIDWGGSITYAHVANWWAATLPSDRGFNNFQTLKQDFLLGKTAERAAFRAGIVDFINESSPSAWAHEYDFSAVQKGTVRLLSVPETLPAGIKGLAFNARRAIFADLLVRHALSLAFDAVWTNKTFMGGDATPDTSYFSNSPLAASGTPSDAELALLEHYKLQISSEIVSAPAKLPITDGSGFIMANLKEALNLLAQAGWHVKNNHLVDADGRLMHFTILIDNPQDIGIILPYIHNLSLLGIDAALQMVDPASFAVKQHDFDFDMTSVNFPESDDPGSEQAGYWGCAAAKSLGSANIAGVCSPAIDAMIIAETQAANRDAKIIAIHALDRLLRGGWYIVPWFHNSTEHIAYWQSRVAKPDAPLQTGVDLSLWWVKSP